MPKPSVYTLYDCPQTLQKCELTITKTQMNLQRTQSNVISGYIWTYLFSQRRVSSDAQKWTVPVSIFSLEKETAQFAIGLWYVFATDLSVLAAILCNKASSRVFGSSWTQTDWLTYICRCLILSTMTLHYASLTCMLFDRLGLRQFLGIASLSLLHKRCSHTDSSEWEHQIFQMWNTEHGRVLGDVSLEEPRSAVWSTWRNTWAGEGTTKTLTAAIA